ncbi:MAG: beta-hydroxyacyl-ACP dehydratase [Deltaproteobacteria bacterium]|nr:beta-hydroxyacyl-ACP dehydratase [Deltaproteobacteria bacterium]
MILTPEEVLAMVPQQEPFRFIDQIIKIDEAHIVSEYRFRPEADFYRGHFPGNPVTPGVILLEAMAQSAVVALGIYVAVKTLGIEETNKLLTFFTDADVEFSGVVRPGDRVTTSAKVVFFRRRKMRSQAEMRLDDGTVVCSGTISGMGIER